MKNKFKKSFLAFGTIAAVAAPVAAVVACGDEDISSHVKVFSQNDNVTDELVALGFQPDYANSWTNEQSTTPHLYPDYFKSGLAKYDIKKGPGWKLTALDREDYINKEIGTVLVDSSDGVVDPNTFKGVANHMVGADTATDRGRYTDKTDFDHGIIPAESAFGINIFKSFKNFATDLDKVYPGKDLATKAEGINAKVQANLKAEVAAEGTLKGKTVSVLEAHPTKVTSAGKQFELERIATPSWASILYGIKDTVGFGFKYPALHKVDSLKVGGWNIKSGDGQAGLITALDKTSDDVIVTFSAYDANAEKYIGAKPSKADVDAYKLTLKDMLSTAIAGQTDWADHIHFVNRDMWKRASQGIYGTNELITKTIPAAFGIKGAIGIVSSDTIMPLDNLKLLRQEPKAPTSK